MKTLLRKCYQEVGIAGANATTFENRISAIEHLLSVDDFFTNYEWMSLTKWAMGVVEDENTESLLVRLEEEFCRTDNSFSLANTKEMHILVEFLIFQYCQNSENTLLLSMVICGHCVGWKTRSKLLYQKMIDYINNVRLSLRQFNSDLSIRTIDIQIPIQTIITLLEPENEDDEAREEQIAQLTGELEKDNVQLHKLTEQIHELNSALLVQREESDILWWMLTEWSETCQKSYRDMNQVEAALFSVYELNYHVIFALGPYAAKQILIKMVSLAKPGGSESPTVASLIDSLDGSTLPEFEECNITEFQPILSALKAKKEVFHKERNSEWMKHYEMRCKKELDNLSMTAVEFGQQLYREIELGRQLFTENGGE